MYRIMLIFSLSIVLLSVSKAQYPQLDAIHAEVDFSCYLRDWDGFGFNYVETAQTTNYNEWAQDYGGFSLLTTNKKQEIIDLIFGEEGLKVGIVKMFLDPWHQVSPGSKFDHASTTSNMREFVRMGLKETRENGRDLEIFTTLYGPPSWATLQKVLRGRDLDPEMNEKLASYMVDWVRYLKIDEQLPVKYLSLHNEGEDWMRWPRDGSQSYIGEGHDYNMWWPSNQMIEFVNLLPDMLKKAGVGDVKPTNGECSNWYRFNNWGDAWALYENEEALKNIGIITSHGFYTGNYSYWYGDHNATGTNLIKKKRPDIHVWVTSSSWDKMDVKFVRQIYGSIYGAEANAFTPWAGIQRPPQWVGGDPNPGNAIQVKENGEYEIRNGYYLYKQVTRAGQPGMKVCKTISTDTEAPVIAFSGAGTNNPNAFVIINFNDYGDTPPYMSIKGDKKMRINIKGSKAKSFKGYRTDCKTELYKYIGEFEVADGVFEYTAPRESVTTFFEIK
jgi:hypothetical protein